MNGPEKNRWLELRVTLASARSVSASRVKRAPSAAWRVRSTVSRAKLSTEIGASVQVMRCTSFVPGNSATLPGRKVGDADTLICCESCRVVKRAWWASAVSSSSLEGRHCRISVPAERWRRPTLVVSEVPFGAVTLCPGTRSSRDSGLPTLF